MHNKKYSHSIWGGNWVWKWVLPVWLLSPLDGEHKKQPPKACSGHSAHSNPLQVSLDSKELCSESGSNAG